MMDFHLYRELDDQIIDVTAQVLFWGVINGATITDIHNVQTDGPNKIVVGVDYIDKDQAEVNRYLVITGAANGCGVFITPFGEDYTS